VASTSVRSVAIAQTADRIKLFIARSSPDETGAQQPDRHLRRVDHQAIA